MIYLFIFSALFLTFLPLWAWYGWSRNKISSSGTGQPVISIVIPFRNEAHRILPLLKSLEHIDYPEKSFEIIFVDDHSGDAGAAMISRWTETRMNARMIGNDQNGHGKKAALTKGIHAATGELILTTDADCQPGPAWLRSMAACFSNEQHAMTPGLVAPLPGSGWLSSLATCDMAALTGFSAGSLALGHPSMCNGANLAFRKKVFLEVNGYKGNEHVPSGDDEFLMHKVSEKYPNGLSYNTDPNAVIRTELPRSFNEFIQQRIRWVSKWRHQAGRKINLLAPLLFMTYLLFLTGWFMAVFKPDFLFLIAGLSLLKFLGDYLLIRAVMRVWGQQVSLAGFLFAELVYPVYVLLFSLLAFRRQYDWKGRRYEEALA